MKYWGKSFDTIARWMALMLFLAFTALQPVFAIAEEDYVFKAPKLSSSAEPYDEEHPELLSADQLYAKSAILIEASTGKIIFEKNSEEQLFPASTTKIMTVYLGVLYGNMDATVYLTQEDLQGIEVGVDADMDLDIGESINFKDLLYGTFIRSANEGANMIARAVSGNISSFVNMMNQTARDIGCINTNFVNPNGLQNDDHFTTASDMAKIARVAMQNDQFRSVASSYTYTLPKSNLHRSRPLTHSSRLFLDPGEGNEYYYSGAEGIKTGYTAAAGYCFVGAAKRDGVELISVVFYTTSTGRWTDTQKLLNYGFSQYVRITPEELYAENPITVITTGFSMNDEEYGRLKLNARLESGTNGTDIITSKNEVQKLAREFRQTVSVEYTRDFSAPIQQGDVFGTMTYYTEDGGTVVYQLVASRTVAERENKPLTLEEIESQVKDDPNPFPPLCVELVLMIVVPVGSVFFIVRFLLYRLGKKERRKRFSIPKPTGREFR